MRQAHLKAAWCLSALVHRNFLVMRFYIMHYQIQVQISHYLNLNIHEKKNWVLCNAQQPLFRSGLE